MLWLTCCGVARSPIDQHGREVDVLCAEHRRPRSAEVVFRLGPELAKSMEVVALAHSQGQALKANLIKALECSALKER